MGVELEMAVVDADRGNSHCVGPYFHNLQAIKSARGEHVEQRVVDGAVIALHAPQLYSSLDNGFNNLETSIGPLFEDGAGSGLAPLHARIEAELADVATALRMEGAAIVNFSQHPAAPIDDDTYRRVRAPKPIYDYWINDRHWRHNVGIDAKAQNGPTTGVPFARAVAALNVILAASPAFIALFGNSPFEDGRITGLKETRLTIWPRMFAQARFAADRRLHRLPARPFADLRDYFEWMFGGDTAMQIVPLVPTHDYKGTEQVVRVLGDPSLLEFLRRPAWPAVRPRCGAPVSIQPSLGHLEFLQFSHFLDARIRFAFATTPTVQAFHEAWDAGGLEELFAAHSAHCYIEGRAPGANFADVDLLEEADATVAASATIAPSALQAGLLRNLEAAEHWLASLDWRSLPVLRRAAICDGMQGYVDGVSLARLADEVVALAAAGLPGNEHWMLAYPQHVLRTGRNGADRALDLYERLRGSDDERMRNLIRARLAVTAPATVEAAVC